MTTGPGDANFQIRGTVRDDTGAPVTGVSVEVSDLRLRAEYRIGTADVGPDGTFSLVFEPESARSGPGASLDVVVTVVRAQAVPAAADRSATMAGTEVLGRSAPRFDAGPLEVIDVRLPAGTVRPADEFSRLVADITRGLAEAGETEISLAAFVEDEQHRDVTYAAVKSGRDPRTVAMASLAERESAATGIPAPLHYALYRAGLPAGQRLWALAPPDVLEAVWSRAVAEGLVAPGLGAQIPASLQTARTLAVRAVLELPTGVGDGRLEDLLGTALPDGADREHFAQIYSRYRKDPETFWSQVQQEFPDVAARLRIDAELAALTRNNTALMGKLRVSRALRRAGDLAAAGYHRPDRWRQELTADVPVPDDVTGDDDDARRDAYAAALALELRLRYPTAVLGAEVADGAIPVTGPAGTGPAVAEFMAAHHDRFELAVHPVDTYLNEHGIELAAPVRDEVAALQRIVAVAPTPEAVRGLRRLGFGSARAVVRHGEQAFVTQFGRDLGGEQAARETFRRSERVHTAVLATATSHLAARAAPEIYAIPSGGPAARSGPIAEARLAAASTSPGATAHAAAAGLAPVHQLPNLETLFGPGDSGACDECESVLSPAAYLVDLFEFLRAAPASGLSNPLDVLLARRPDLENIALSCENTEIELPYVDLANEVLEYVVVHDSIDGYAGHDVAAGISSADLLASPQFVDDTAYTILKTASYPSPLPWDLYLAALRGYLAQAGVTLRDAMAVLSPDDANGRSWSDVVRERLGIGPAERDLLSGSAVTPQALYGDDPAHVTSAQLVAGAANASRLARRLGVTPADLIAVIRTRFVNPDADLLVLLAALKVPIATVKGVHDGTITPGAFRALLPPQLDPAPYGGDVVAWLTARYDRIMNIVVLTDPTGQPPLAGDSTGGFTAMELRRALPDPALNQLRAVDLLSIARFVRLRTRLGWSIERTSDVVTALWPVPVPVPGSEADVRSNLDAGFGAVLIRLGHLLTAADLLGLDADADADADLPWLLGCFAPLRDTGPGSPYRTLFPATTLLGSDPAFGPGPDGEPPADPSAKLLDHRPALQSALKLTADELDVVIEAAGADSGTLLSLDSISRLFRYGYLARTLQIGVADLTGLISATGWKPFDPLDQPDPDLLKLIRLVQSATATELPLSRLVALALGTDPADAALDLLRAVRAALVDPRAPADGQWSQAALRSALTTVYPPDVADAFLGLLAGTATYTTPYLQDQPVLPDTVQRAAPHLAYDAAGSLLIHRGVLTPQTAAAVTGQAGLPPGLAVAIAVLVNAGQAEYQPLLQANPALNSLWNLWLATPPDDPGDPARLGTVGTALLADLRPALQLRQLAQVLAPALGADAETAAALVTDPAAVAGSAPGSAAGDDLTAVTATGFSARFWAGPATATPARTAVAPELDYGPGTGDLRQVSGIAAGTISGSWAAVADPPVSGAVSLSVETDGSAVTVQVNGTAVALQRQDTSAGTGTWTTAAPVRLSAGQAVRLQVEITGATAQATLRWQAGSLPAMVVPGAACCPADLADAFAAAYRRLQVALELMAGTGLSARELLVLAGLPAYQIGRAGWLSAIPAGAAPAAATSGAIAAGVASLARYRQLRERWAVTGTAIADLLDADGPGPSSALIAPLAGVTPATVDAITAHLHPGQGALRSVDWLRQLADVAALTRSVALPVDVLARVMRVTPAPQDARDLRDAVQARYDASAWADVVQPIHNQLRRAARDALVAQVLQQQNPDPDLHPDGDAVTGGYATADELYEKLLIDVQMDPCMTTSRIAQAISTVQLFVARVLLNLEPEVSPAAIDTQRWEVMRHYRVWEANRRVFLFPENWLDPELRDDKSPFFKDIESELLQSDITDEAAATALGHYLEQLDGVAKLEIAAMHVEERAGADGGPDPLVHVIGRTAGAKRGYYHRTLDDTWFPWEPINADIPDNPVVPVVWQGRLLLFWLTTAQQPDPDQAGPFQPGAPQASRIGDLKVGDLKMSSSARQMVSLNWTEYYNGRWQPPRTSDPARPIDLGSAFTVLGDPPQIGLGSDIVPASTGIRESLGVIVLNRGQGAFDNTYFRLYTTHSVPIRKQEDTGSPPGFLLGQQFSTTAGALVVTYAEAGQIERLTVLHATPSPYQAVGPLHRLQDPQDAPFFFQDSMYVFYVQPTPPAGGAQHAFGVFPRPAAALAAFPELTDPGTRHD